MPLTAPSSAASLAFASFAETSFKLTFLSAISITSLLPAAWQLDLGQRDVSRTRRLEFRTVERDRTPLNGSDRARREGPGRPLDLHRPPRSASLGAHPGDRHMRPERPLLGLVEALRRPAPRPSSCLESLGRPATAPAGRTSRGPPARRPRRPGRPAPSAPAGSATSSQQLGDRARPRPPSRWPRKARVTCSDSGRDRSQGRIGQLGLAPGRDVRRGPRRGRSSATNRRSRDRSRLPVGCSPRPRYGARTHELRRFRKSSNDLRATSRNPP